MVAALASSDTERGYPPSIGSARLRAAAAAWLGRRFDVDVDPRAQIGACVGTKEFVASLPQWLRLRTPERDTVLYPAVAYPTYEMGAIFAGCRAVPVPPDASGGARPRPPSTRPTPSGPCCLWVNSPSNPTGALDDLGAAAAWGRGHGVPVFSDECYAEFTWDGPARIDPPARALDGVVAVHSLSKRSNLAGVRVGFYAGDADLVDYLQEVRKHAGLMVPGPAQAAGVAALDDDEHVAAPARPLPSPSRPHCRRALAEWAGVDVAAARRRLLPLVRRRRRVGRSPNAWPRRAARSSARGVLRQPRERDTCASPWYNLTTASISSSSDCSTHEHSSATLRPATRRAPTPASPPEAAARRRARRPRPGGSRSAPDPRPRSR